ALAFGRSVCEEEVSSPILDKKTMKKKRFHRPTPHKLQWFESYSLFFSTQFRKTNQDLVSEPKNTDEEKSDVNMIFKFSWIIAITAEIKMGRKLRKTTTDAVAEILVVPCSRGGLWRGTDFDFQGYLQEHHFLFLLALLAILQS
ncbi:unnamed protein product, partial [Brassica rapa subsp. trilocularis]